jgi:hypothetical protein
MGSRSADIDHRLRALVIAHGSAGSTAAVSNASAVVTSSSTSVTTTTATTGKKAPSLAFISLRRVGVHVYTRFRICDDRTGRITVVEPDNVGLNSSCAVYLKSWIPGRPSGASPKAHGS